ncbi:ABC transporter ATP-binding protein [Halocella sp. SP3-1]|uniref:ABC transporter ATP-binding protein n=1 Tax=Halocella sp. SP3-1 TaxID=2382161 RepID=UPI000F763B60|nr:ABC transporter ATP-binding protein [Halocella sp. SP3-1]AZO95962.1 ABC transporter ATP-binding protein [Halocella sp. SP3-1]
MKEIKKVFAFAKEYHYKLYTAVLLAVLSVFIGIIPFYLVYRIIMRYMGDLPLNFNYLLLISGLICLSLLAKSFFFLKAMANSHEVAFDTLMGMRKKLADKLLRLPMGEIKKRGSGKLKNIFVDMIEEMELILAHMIPEGVSYIIVPLSIVVYLFFLDWRMALLSLGNIPVSMFIFHLMMNSNKEKLESWFKAGAEMNANIVEYIGGMEVIKIFNQTTTSFKKYTESVRDYEKFTLDWYRESWTYMAGFFTILPCTMLFVIPFGALFYLQGSLPLSVYILSMLLSMSLGEPLSKLARFIESITMLTKKSQAINQILDSQELVKSELEQIPRNSNISFKRVSFAYDEEEVLSDISFTAKENTVTALVGESGSGKSTIAKLLVRFWDVKDGEIKIDNIDIKNIPFAKLMDSISYVSQDIFLFDTSIMENIRMGRPEAVDEEVIKVARIAQCHDFIMELDKGYDTLAGDAGNKLSGGQKQRISIARALLKDAPIIILDEATAFTDPENEDKIQEALNDLIKGKTLIVIAHRLSTITAANNIIVMDNGQIAAQGTHQELLDKSEIYQKMWKAHTDAMDWNINVKGGSLNA